MPGVEADELMMSWWGFLLKFEPQALLIAQDPSPYNGNRMINFLVSFSVTVITMVSGCFKNTNKLINAVIDKTRKIELSRALKLSARNWNLI